MLGPPWPGRRDPPAPLAIQNARSPPPVDRDKSALTATDEEAVRLADALEDHPSSSDVTDMAELRGRSTRAAKATP
ncbi:hypothetical protein GCM10023257_11500 [Streptomyces hyderabadensis]|uniref:Uncharacterized protein n=1 Tax=Streptomyces hyderabadensis TaxID=598549 RepID=A0ABP9HRE3_9ACTN